MAVHGRMMALNASSTTAELAGLNAVAVERAVGC